MSDPYALPRGGEGVSTNVDMPTSSIHHPAAADFEVAKLREVVAVLNEVAAARRNEAEALQQQLDVVIAEHDKLYAENHQLKMNVEELQHGRTAAVGDTSEMAAENRHLKELLSSMQDRLARMQHSPRASDEHTEQLSRELREEQRRADAASAELEAALEKQRVTEAQLAEARRALQQKEREFEEQVKELRASAGAAQQLKKKKLASGKWREEYRRRKALSVEAKPSHLLPNAIGAAVLVANFAALLYILVVSYQGRTPLGSISTAASMAYKGGLAQGVDQIAAFSDPLYNATHHAISVNTTGGVVALLGELVEAGFPVDPPKSWRAVVGVCTALDSAFPNPSRDPIEAELLVKGICWGCQEAAAYVGGISWVSLFALVVFVALESLVAYVLISRKRRAQRKDPPKFIPTEEEVEKLQNLLPVIMVPQVDLDGGNGITKVWVGPPVTENERMTVEVSVGFADEDRPDAITDMLYDLVRSVLFGREEDIETFRMVYDLKWRLLGFEFTGTYAGDQHWYDAAPTHHSKYVKSHELQTDAEGRIVLWVTTWNHLFSERNTNVGIPSLIYVPITPSSYKVLKATRAEVDATFSGFITSVA